MRLCLFLLTACLLGCTSPAKEAGITVAAAANLYYPLQEINKAFVATYPDCKVECVFGPSGKLTTQVIHGAPYDLFLSADTAFPAELMARRLAVTIPRVYATGTLVLFSIKPRNFDAGLKLLLDKDLKTVSLANPELAPYGAMSVAALRKAGIFEAVQPKIAYTENISQVVQHVMSAADAGFIAKSALYSGELAAYNREGVHWTAVDPELYDPIKQAFIILKNGKGKKWVKEYYDFILDKTARRIFAEYGYGMPDSG